MAEVCRAPKQFSCWNRNDPNYRLICRVADTDIVFCICKRIAGRAVAGLLEDKTNGATHYHARHVWPDWAKGKIPCAEIGRHFFYNDIEK
ncbi:MAG: cell wall hydrolase [Alphaproteobacteria bacterium]